MRGLATEAYKINLNDNLTASERAEVTPFIFKAITDYLEITGSESEELVKSITTKQSSRIWNRNELAPVADLEDWFYLYIAEPLLKFQNAVAANFGLSERNSLRKAMRGYDANDMTLIDELIQKYFPSPSKNKITAEALAVKSHLLGIIEEGETPALTMRALLINKLPATIKEAMKTYKVKEQAARSMEFAKDFSGSLIQTEIESIKEGTKRIILDSYRNNYGTVKIQSLLFDKLGQHNRDWRRIAVTEVSFGRTNGYLARLEQGQWVVGDSAPDACEHCKDLINGKIYQKVDAPGDWDTQVWVGKTNYNRTASHFRRENETWVKKADDEVWKPTIPLHPNCRCGWTRFHPESEWIDEKGYARMREENPEKFRIWYNESFNKGKVKQ